MKMVVEITNLTDAPGNTPRKVSILDKTLRPGVCIKLDAALVDSKIRSLEKSGLISIGAAPSWYEAYKQKKGATLTLEEIKSRLGAPRRKNVKPTVNVTIDASDQVEVVDTIVVSPKKKKRGRKKKAPVEKE